MQLTDGIAKPQCMQQRVHFVNFKLSFSVYRHCYGHSQVHFKCRGVYNCSHPVRCEMYTVDISIIEEPIVLSYLCIQLNSFLKVWVILKLHQIMSFCSEIRKANLFNVYALILYKSQITIF